MKISDIFEIDDYICIEPSMMSQTDEGCTAMFLESVPDFAKLLVDEDEDPVACAFNDEGKWVVSSYLYRPFSGEILNFVEDLNGDIYQEKREVYACALRKYYCDDILMEFPTVTEDNRSGRYEMIESLLNDLVKEGSGKTAVDFCCGSGVATKVLSDMGCSTISFDYDASLLSCGIQHKRINPQLAMCIDAREASLFCDPSDIGIGLMLGDITNFDAPMWEDIVFELLSLSKKSVITTATRREIEMVAGWCMDAGRKPEIIENERDPIYDVWVCFSEE
ncbi:MAG: hypothetical protein PHP13_04160 [Methanomicrobium sp.]|nr:hypothetical protein [Methanomicrobium sp.]